MEGSNPFLRKKITPKCQQADYIKARYVERQRVSLRLKKPSREMDLAILPYAFALLIQKLLQRLLYICQSNFNKFNIQYLGVFFTQI
jgi:hypothetical protein